MTAQSWKKSLLIIWFCHFTVDLFTGIWPAYKSLAHLDIAKAGIILGLAGFIGDGSQILFGPIADRGLRKKCIGISFLCALIASMLGMINDYSLLFFIMLMLYLASGMFHPAAAGIVQGLLPKRKSFAMAIFSTGGALGLSLSQLLFSSLYKIDPLLTLLFALFPLVAFFVLKSSTVLENKKSSVNFSFSHFFDPFLKDKNRRPFTLLYLCQLCQQSITYGFIFLLPDLLLIQGHSSWTCFGGGHCLMIIGGCFLLIPVGLLADKIGQKKAMMMVLALTTTTFYLFILQGHQIGSLVLPLIFILGGLMGSFNPIGVSLGNRLIPGKASTISALLMGGVWCFSHVFGSAVGGMMTQLFTHNAIINALLVLGLLYPLSMICLTFVPVKKAIALASELEVVPGSIN